MKRFNFDRYQNGRLMAEGVTVHAGTLDEAKREAEGLADRVYPPGWRLQFADNLPCPKGIPCPICNPQA